MLSVVVNRTFCSLSYRYVTGEIFPEGSFQVLHDEIFKKSLNEDAVMSHYEDGYDYYWPKGAFELKNKKTEGQRDKNFIINLIDL